MQVDPGLARAWYQRLKLNNDEPLSNFASNFNLCLYITFLDADNSGEVSVDEFAKVTRCKLTLQTRVESAWFLRLKLKYDTLLSSFAFNLRLRPYAAAMLRMNIDPRLADRRRIVEYYDSDGDGYIQWNEFVRRVLPEHEHPGYWANSWQSIAHHDPKPPNIMPVSHMLYVNQAGELLTSCTRPTLNFLLFLRASV